jgi:hypothetical protein
MNCLSVALRVLKGLSLWQCPKAPGSNAEWITYHYELCFYGFPKSGMKYTTIIAQTFYLYLFNVIYFLLLYNFIHSHLFLFLSPMFLYSFPYNLNSSPPYLSFSTLRLFPYPDYLGSRDS